MIEIFKVQLRFGVKMENIKILGVIQN